jgi:cobalt-zinc-cadmium efflux system protein
MHSLHPPEAGEINHKPIGNWNAHEHRPHEQRQLTITLLLTTVAMVIEAIGGWLSGSLALLTDAAHMLTHALSLGVSLLAIRIAQRPTSKSRSYGLYRVEILAALFNGLTMFAVVAVIIAEAIDRMRYPIEIASTEMFLIGLFGLAVNLVCALILGRAYSNDINVRSAFFHMLGDTLSSVGVVAGAIIIYYSSWVILDPLISLGISVVIAVWGFHLVRDAINILLETTPKHISVDHVIHDICAEIDEVHQIHDVHIWEITSNMYTMTAHALTDDLQVSQTHELLDRIQKLLRERFNICHVNIQFECQG